MSERIWKFPLTIWFGFPFEVSMPDGAKILHLDTQNDDPTIWAIFDDVNRGQFMPRSFQIFGTDELIVPVQGKRKVYIGTWQTKDGYVWHLFEWVAY